MDDDHVDVEAQPGPIYEGEFRPEQSPLTCVDVAFFGGFVFLSLGMVAGGAVILAVTTTAGKSMADVYVGNVVCGAVMVFFGAVLTATFVAALVIEWRRSRRIRAVSRLHIAPVAPLPTVGSVTLSQLPASTR